MLILRLCRDGYFMTDGASTTGNLNDRCNG
jgi:hypothetical protein